MDESHLIRVLVVDDHPIVLKGLRALLSSYPDIVLVAEAESPPVALGAARRDRPDVAVVDIKLAGGDGIDLATRLRQLEPAPKVIILSSYDDEGYLTRALEADVHAFLLKDASDEKLVDAIRSVHRGERLLSSALLERVMREFAQLRRQQAQTGTGLTPDEHRVLSLLASGASNAAIAAGSHWSSTSVKRRLQDIFRKMGVSNRAEAAAEAVRRGLV